jgi:transitional endoplasmic reticulum ATPase
LATRQDKPAIFGVVSELLTTIPEFRRRPGRLLVCATNFVGSVDPAVLRPGRFDLLVSIGPPDAKALDALWTQALGGITTADDVDATDLVKRSIGFTLGDVDLAAQRAAAAAFDRARDGGGDGVVTRDDLLVALGRTYPSITSEMIRKFELEVAQFERV